MQSFTGEVGNIRREQGHDRLHRRIIEPLLHLGSEPADRNADANSAGGNKQEPQAGFSDREMAGHHCCHRESKGDERGRVIGEAFPFEDSDDFSRHAHVLRH